MTTRGTDPARMNDEEIRRRQRSRNIAVALALGAFVVIVFLVSIVRMQAGVETYPGGLR